MCCLPIKFRIYLTNFFLYTQIEEFKHLMTDLGLLANRSYTESSSMVVSAFTAADLDRDNTLSVEEFLIYYRRATAPRLIDVLRSDYPEDIRALRQMFTSWATFGLRDPTVNKKTVQLGTAHYMKLLRDTGLVGRRGVSTTDADLIYTKVKPKGQLRLSFVHFVDALGAIAELRSRDVLSVVRQITSSPGPVLNGTTVQVKQMYGTATASRQRPYANMPAPPVRRASAPPAVSVEPIPVAQTPTLDLKALNDYYSPPTSDEFKIGAHRSDDGSDDDSRFHTSFPSPDSTAQPNNIEEVLRVFGEFAIFGLPKVAIISQPTPLQMEMDSKQFMKLCKECRLCTGMASAAAVDLCFAKAKQRNARKIGFSEFLVALAMLAQEKGLPESKVMAMVGAIEAPRRNSTTPEFCRFHDDKSTFTGVYARGGPSSKDSLGLAMLVSREGNRVISG